MKKITLSILLTFISALTFAQIAEVEPNDSRDASGTITFSANTPQTGTGTLVGLNADFWNFPAQITGALEFTLTLNASSPNTYAYFNAYQLDGTLISSETTTIAQGANVFSKTVQSDRIYSLSLARNNASGSVSYSLELTTATVDPSLSNTSFELEPSDFFYNNNLNQISISNKVSDVKIYNLLGQNVLNSNTSIFSLNTLKKGVYIANIISKKGFVASKKFVVN